MKSKKTEFVAAAAAFLGLTILVSYLLTTWVSMLLLGAISHIFGLDLFLSFWQSSIVWFVAFAFNLIFKRG